MTGRGEAPIVEALRLELSRWEELLAALSPEELTASRSAAGWSIRDYVAHLRAWQQVSNARLEAAGHGSDPTLPGWLGGEDPESEAHLQRFNETIYALNRDHPWSRVHGEWRDGFTRLLGLAAAVPEPDLLDAARFPWLKGHPLMAVLEGTLAHHREHRGLLFPGS